MSNPSALPEMNGRPAAGRERRLAIRYAGHPDAACRAYAPSAGIYTAWIRDISSTGVSLLMACQFEPGALLTLELENRAEGVTTFLHALVVHAMEVPPDGRWLHGCALERPLTDEELYAFAE
jgi:hypothetical protein